MPKFDSQNIPILHPDNPEDMQWLRENFISFGPPPSKPEEKPLPRNRPRTPRPGEAVDHFDGSLNEQEARRLGLERVEIKGSLEAQDLIARVFDQSRSDAFDVMTKTGQKAFNDAWQKNCPNILPPNGSDFWYLKQLQAGTIISNLDLNNPQHAHPHFDQPSILWMQDWQEEDYINAAFQKTSSPLFQELLGTSSVVKISRTTIDQALWTGDPSQKTKTPKHTELIKNLGLDPRDYHFRLVRQDEYARLAGSGENFGNSNLWTWFDDYQFEGERVYGLVGGSRDYGGASNVADNSRGHAYGNIAVRLVLECNK
jgi:hypothetical protein